MQIIPSILESDQQSFEAQLTRLSPYFNYFQIDIADGLLVPNKTVQIEDIINILTVNKNLSTANLTFDFHLMVKDYQKEIEKLNQLTSFIKITNVLIHARALGNNPFPSSAIPVGLVLDPPDQVNSLSQKYDLNKIPVIQIMTVNPGFQGSPFIPDLLNKIEQLRSVNYRNKIFLDGGINEKTIPLILQQKFLPDALGIGSYLTKSDQIEERIKFLKEKTSSVSASF